ncbi:hypothetical protein LguiB_034249 [Lonicera macranthoides]
MDVGRRNIQFHKGMDLYLNLSPLFLYYTQKHPQRLTKISLLPVVLLFLNLPLHLHTMHLGGLTAFFIAWLANFKLLMFAFSIGPLSHPSLSLSRFIALACLPIKIQQNPHPNTPSLKSPKKGQKSLLNYSFKALLVALIVRVYDYHEHIHPTVMMFVFAFHVYFGLEISLAVFAAAARVLLGAELEPQFNEPYLSTSLQDFWGRRWNIMVSSILRPTVYKPVLCLSARLIGRELAPLPAVFGTFVVSALMHELVFYYLGRVKPTGEISTFFLLHGVCLLGEIALKKWVNGRWRVPQVVSGPLTVGFVLATGGWLFFPVLLRCKADARALDEYAAVGAFVKDVRRALTP